MENRLASKTPRTKQACRTEHGIGVERLEQSEAIERLERLELPAAWMRDEDVALVRPTARRITTESQSDRILGFWGQILTQVLNLERS